MGNRGSLPWYDLGPVAAIALLVACSAVLLVAGLLVRRTGRLRSRPAALLWAIVTVAPVFVGGTLLIVQEQARPSSGPRPSGDAPLGNLEVEDGGKR